MLDGKYDKVIQALEPAVLANPNDIGVSNRLVNAYVRVGKAEEAIALYKQRIKKEPGSPDLHGRYAQALMDFARLEEAAVEWKKAFDLDPKNLFFKQKLAETYAALEQYTQAKKEFQELEGLASDDPPWFKNVASSQILAIDEQRKAKKR